MSIDIGMDKEDVCIYMYIYISTHTHTHTLTHIHTMEYYSTIKKNEIMPFAATWMGPRDFHIEQSKSDRGEISNDIHYMWKLKRNHSNELTTK